MTNQKTALITGIHGQDGYYLSRLLLEKDYRVVGLGRGTRGPHWPHASRIDYRFANLRDLAYLIQLLEELRPSEIYNLAAQSFVPLSWQQPIGTLEANGLPVISLLEAMRATDHEIRFFQASSAQMFGQHHEQPCSEQTPFSPQNPYATSKLFAHMMTVDYREGQRLFTSCGILFNHESPLRPQSFVTRKIALDAVRDWGHAADFVHGMWLSLQVDEPTDYIFCTGEAHSVEDFARVAFEVAGLNWRDHLVRGDTLSRTDEPDILVGTPDRAQELLGWRARTGFSELVEKMVQSELQAKTESQELE